MGNYFIFVEYSYKKPNIPNRFIIRNTQQEPYSTKHFYKQLNIIGLSKEIAEKLVEELDDQ